MRRGGVEVHLLFLVSFTLLVFLIHGAFVDLPYYWDEIGQFIPQSLDLYQHGRLIPESTRPNTHPPALPLLLAGWWTITGGPAVESTRCLMLLLAGIGVYLSFLLAIELLQGLPGAPAFAVVFLLLASPLFYMQSMMAQLDLPCALFSTLALWCFLRKRYLAAALACGISLAFKETAVAFPIVFAVVLWRQARKKEATWMLASFLLPLGWIVWIGAATGQLLGDAKFADFNLWYNLHPARLLVALARRLYTLFIADFHWLAILPLLNAWWVRRLWAGESWTWIRWIAAVHILVVSAFGGAVLERYLLPLWPLLFCAIAAAASLLSERRRLIYLTIQTAAFAAGLWIRPLHPFPLENNLAMVEQVRLWQEVARTVDQLKPGALIATAWPLSDALRRPEFGYVERGRPVVELPDFRASNWRAANLRQVEVVLIYSRDWTPEWNLLGQKSIRAWWRWLYDYEPPMNPDDAATVLGAGPALEWRRGSQWVSLFLIPRPVP